MDELADRTAVVTGAASGIGLALCEALAREGMRVVMADVDPTRLGAAAEQVGGDVLAVPTDASRCDSVAELARRAVERFGAVHVLCNNAGVTRPGAAWEPTLDEWDWVLGVNLRGVVHGVKAFVPGMIERGVPAHLVNTASIGGLLAERRRVVAVVETLEDQFERFVSDLPPDPRPFYAELRERASVFRTPFGFWYVTRYDLAQAVIRNDAAWSVSSVASSSAGPPDEGSFAFDVMHQMMLTLDGEDHARPVTSRPSASSPLPTR
jgi:NAD(P)-dependent dehydrogenase (short-subunit alcohol dehydrogenase family)